MTKVKNISISFYKHTYIQCTFCWSILSVHFVSIIFPVHTLLIRNLVFFFRLYFFVHLTREITALHRFYFFVRDNDMNEEDVHWHVYRVLSHVRRFFCFSKCKNLRSGVQVYVWFSCVNLSFVHNVYFLCSRSFFCDSPQYCDLTNIHRQYVFLTRNFGSIW